MANPIVTTATKVLKALFENDPSGEGVFDGDDLMKFTALSPQAINDSVEYLYSKGLLERQDYLGTTPFHFGHVNLNVHGKHLYHEQSDDQNKNTEKHKSPQKTSYMKIFISHSNKDVEVAKAIIDLLRISLNLKTRDIRCTSVDGYRLPAGVSTDAQLKTEIHDSEVLVGLISAESMSSHYVLFELGARWGAEKPLFPLITDGEGAKVLKGPLQGINALNAYEEAQLFQLVDDIGEKLDIKPESPNSYQRHVKAVVNLLTSRSVPPEKSVKDAGANSPSTSSTIKDDYSNSEEQIKAHCKKQWPEDFHMQAHCITEQRNALRLLQEPKPEDISDSEFALIRKKAAKDWPDDYHMRAHQEQEQFKAIRNLRD